MNGTLATSEIGSLALRFVPIVLESALKAAVLLAVTAFVVWMLRHQSAAPSCGLDSRGHRNTIFAAHGPPTSRLARAADMGCGRSGLQPRHACPDGVRWSSPLDEPLSHEADQSQGALFGPDDDRFRRWATRMFLPQRSQQADDSATSPVTGLFDANGPVGHWAAFCGA